MLLRTVLLELPDAKSYYLRNIMHNYSDTVCSDILKYSTKAMSSDSVFLLSEKIFSRRLERLICVQP